MARQFFHHKLTAALGILFVTLIWGFSYVVTKTAMEAITPLWFAFIRLGTAALLLLLLDVSSWRQLTRRCWRDGLVVGIPVGLAECFQIVGLNNTTASNSAFITGFYVVLVPIIGWFITRRLSGRHLLIAIVALISTAAFSLDGNLQFASGDLWTLACAVCFAVQYNMLGIHAPKYSGMLFTAVQLAVAAVVSLIAACCFEPLPTAASFTPRVIWSLLFSIVGVIAVGYTIQTEAQKVLPATTASVLFTAECIFGALCGILFLGDRFIVRQVIGGVVMIACMVCSILLAEQMPASRQPEEKTA